MTKKILSLLLCCALLLTFPLVVWAEEETVPEAEPVAEPVTITIATPEEFLTFAESCRLDSYSQNLVVELTADISLGDTTFEGIPIFCGTFQGNDHTISDLNITGEGSVLGLFRYLTETAVVRDLHITGLLQPQGSKSTVGALAGSNAGSIQNCSFSGEVSGSEHIGGLVGINTVTGILQDCKIDGTVHGEHFVGGIAGENLGVIRSCVNNASVNTTPQQNSVELSQITLDTLANSEAANTVTDIGGIAGSSGGVIRDCENYGPVGYPHMGYNIGGIAGSQMGYITGCVNYAAISGRKEVGGIVGHMEPVTSIVFTTDTLQILQGQLDTLGSLADQATAHAQGSASAVTSQIAGIRDKAESAKDAVQQLIPDEENPQLPDMDSLQAAQNTLNSSLTGIQGSLSSMAATVQSTASTLSRDMAAISNQVKAMDNTIDNAGENLGGTIVDISDNDTPEDLAGKVESCENHGDILADLNAGGIAGAIALENDLDPEEDIQITGDTSLNFDSELRAVILSCDNRGSVTAGKQNVGGIAGWMSMGLAKDCLNTGSLEAENATYVGGIAGQSTGFIRQCNVNGTITGSSYVGGIAGKADTVTANRCIVLLTAAEKDGSIVGYAESRENIADNYYMPVQADIGAIDGISYDGCAQPLSPEAFLALENLEGVFRTVAVTFRFADGSEKNITVPYGEAISPEAVPEIPAVENGIAYWEGLTQEPLYFDAVYPAAYTAYASVIESEAKDGSFPRLLAEGIFAPGATVTLLEEAEAPTLQKGQALLEVFAFTVSESSDAITIRYRLTQAAGEETPILLAMDEAGQWAEIPCYIDGSYVVFTAPATQAHIAVITEASIPWLLIGVAAGVVILTAVLIIVKVRKKRPVSKS